MLMNNIYIQVNSVEFHIDQFVNIVLCNKNGKLLTGSEFSQTKYELPPIVSRSSLLNMSFAHVEQFELVFEIHALHIRSPTQFKHEFMAVLHSLEEHVKYQYLGEIKLSDFTWVIYKRKKAKFL